MQRRVLYILILGFIGINTIGCKNRKKVSVTEVPKPITQISVPEVLNKSESVWQFYSSKADVSVEGSGISKSADATIKMQKDSIIWISVGMFGFEGLRIFMEPDSITILNKLDRSFTRMGWTEIGKYVGTELNLTKTQNLLVANLLLARDTNFKLNKDSSLYFIERIVVGSIYKLRFDESNYSIGYSFFRGEKTGKYLTIDYKDYEKVEVGHFPKSIKLSAKDGLKKFDVDLKITNISTSSFGALPTNVPSSFKRQ